MLRETDLPITDIAFSTGWKSLGTFGRIFRDITGESPGNLRARERRSAPAGQLVPECMVRAVQRPDLKASVSEKRREQAVETMGLQSTEDS
jgi:AraC-like DNA-binding protein